MTFLARMTTETGTPMPRWLYLLLKPVETIGIAVALHAYLGIAPMRAAWIAVALYVGIGLLLWYRRRSFAWFGPASLTGDALYHGVLSAVAPVVVWEAVGVPVRLAITVVLLVCWWLLDTAGYGPMRDPNSKSID